MRDGGDSPAEIYEHHTVQRFGLIEARDLLELLPPAVGDRVLDVACGTGTVARLVAERVAPRGRVIGLDIAAPMLAVGRRVVTQPNVTWLTGDGVGLPFEDGIFDLVFCQQGLQFFADRPQALREMRRVLRSGGRLGVSCWRPAEDSPPYAAIQRALGRRVGPEHSALPRFALGDAAHLRTLIEDAGFRDILVHSRTILVEWPSTDLFVRAIAAGAPTMMGALGAQDGMMLSAIAREVEGEMHAFLQENGALRFPMGNHHVTARA